LFSDRVPVPQIRAGIRETLMRRHDGEEDFTITTQTEMLDTLDRILGVINLAVAAIAGISLVVGAIGILTIMWISVGERTSEIGLVMALGALRRQLLGMFLIEAALLSLTGGLIGVAVGLGLAAILRWVVPGLPLDTPVLFIGLALGVSLAVGLLAGVLPARRAAHLDPVEALHAE
jgi:putative ABC transport system permease protein